MAAPQSRVPRIGLTGGIGSGKSTVATCWVQRGAALIDTDAIARALTLSGGAAMTAIAQAFGPGLVTHDGALDRAAMRQQVFADPSSKARLEAILHPLIGDEADRQAAAAAHAPVIVFDVPLLVEARERWCRRVDRVLVVDCSAETQLARVMARSGWTEAAVRAVIAQQASRQARREVADAVIFNEGLTLDQLGDEVGQLWQRWVA